jgi:hypothetical protein
MRTVLKRNLGFDNADNNFGPGLYSRDLYLEQCETHLYDVKGTYEYTAKPKDLKLNSVSRRLKTLLNDCGGKESTTKSHAHQPSTNAHAHATKSHAHILSKWIDDSVIRAHLANFYVFWKLHKKTNAQGVRTRPISNNIGYPTGQVSHFLHRQLIMHTPMCSRTHSALFVSWNHCHSRQR